jgi:general secretion pathway protein N
MTKVKLRGLAVAVLALMPCAVMAQSPPADAPVRSFAMPPLDELQATRERPLFSPRRRPDEQVVTETETPVTQAAPESAPFDLTGIVMGEDRAVAILHNRETQETVHLRQGETAQAWSVAEIAQRHVVLRSEDKQVRLQLFEPKPEGAEGQAAAPPPPRPPEINQQRQRRASPDQPSLRRNSDRQQRERQQRRRTQ